MHRHCTTFIVALLLVLLTSPARLFAHDVAPNISHNVSPSKQTVLAAAKLSISSAKFSRAAVVVLKGGTLTLVNTDDVAYRIKIGATILVVPAKGSKTVPLPQRGTFSITCAKAPTLRATITVK